MPKLERCQRQKRRRRLAVLVVIIVAAYHHGISSKASPTARHPRNFHGEEEARLLLMGHEGLLYDILRMRQRPFLKLVSWLEIFGGVKEGTYISTSQKVLIFFELVAQGASTRYIAARYSRGLGTINRIFHEVLRGCLLLAKANIKPPAPETQMYIRRRPDLYPFFRNCVGAIDGTHFRTRPEPGPNGDQKIWFNYKGYKSQNVLACCDFEGRFTYVLAGWAGSANDKIVYSAAQERGDLTIPAGKYLLADGGFGMGRGLLVPYQSVRYHIQEWEASGLKPKNSKELYNKRHSSLRIMIERVFGVLKAKFRIHETQPFLDPRTQAMVIFATCGLINYLVDERELVMDQTGDGDGLEERCVDAMVNDECQVDEGDEGLEAKDGYKRLRVVIADELFADYESRTHRRRK